jgi:uncharacterized caspase-like protein
VKADCAAVVRAPTKIVREAIWIMDSRSSLWKMFVAKNPENRKDWRVRETSRTQDHGEAAKPQKRLKPPIADALDILITLLIKDHSLSKFILYTKFYIGLIGKTCVVVVRRFGK